VQTGPQAHEYVLIDAETGKRQTAPALKELGIMSGDSKTSTLKIDVHPTRRTGESSGFKFINKLSEDVDLFWINQQGEHIRYGSIRAGTEREQHSYEGHVWLITSPTGEHLASVEAEATIKTLIIDGKGLTKAKDEPKKPVAAGKSPDGSCIVTSEADAVPKRQITIVDSSPKDGLQPKIKVIDYTKPGDPLPKPQLVITGTGNQKFRVPKDLHRVRPS
jgi:hypothetical protein